MNKDTINHQNVNGTDKTEPLQRTECNIHTANGPVLVDDLLLKEVGCYLTCHDKTQSKTNTIGAILVEIRTDEKLKELVNVIRNAPDGEMRDKLIRQLPCVNFDSEPQQEWKDSACKPNGILCINFYGIPQEEIEEAKKEIAECPYVLAVWCSISDTELIALIAYTGMPDMERLVDAMQDDFSYKIDESSYEISRVQFASYDENIIINDQVFPVELTELAEEDDTPLQYKPFPIDCLPETMRNITNGIQKTLGLKDCSMIAVCGLAVISAIIGALCQIRIKEDYVSPVHIYTAIIARSGHAKSGVMSCLLDLIKRIQKKWFDEYTTANTKYKKERIRWKNTKKDQRGDSPNLPLPQKRLFVSDTSKAALFQRLRENLYGLLLYLDELDFLFCKMGRYSNDNERPHFLTIHTGEPLMVDRIKPGGECYIPNPSLAICGGIQPQIFRDHLCRNPNFHNSGLLPRFLMAMPPVESVKMYKKVVPKEAKERYEHFILTFLSVRGKALVDGKTNPLIFPITNEAWYILSKYQHQHADISSYETDENKPIEVKYLTHVIRIALILHIVELYENDNQAFDKFFEARSTESCPDLPPVSYETMLNACIIVEWFVNEMKRVYATFIGDCVTSEDIDGDLPPIQREVMIVLRKLNKPATVRDLKRSSTEIRRMEDTKIDSVLQVLIDAGRIQGQKRTNGYHHASKTIEYSIVDPNVTTPDNIEANQHGDNDNDNITDEDVPDIF